MSVKHAILTLLSESPRHRYDLKVSFESMVYHQWELNAGQIYTTIDRLVRDGLVEETMGDSSELKIYRISEKGNEELFAWLLQPVEKTLLKDEFYFKLLCAKKISHASLQHMIKSQQEHIIQTIFQLQKLRRSIDPTRENEGILYLIEGKILHLEADMKWLSMFPHTT
ncbi:PadR family transcriptional regulator [Brevibacillus ruminantium]|uniref:PadR family transcriptional regulator n=1 Tax=Brevibacillus ruminantium TaxID=2950604 RepID=A0ABY4WHK5_9BACL|nr:PadR family transcriptional regulator [Brevibacillus ruminantium]USG66577.1 PadR family transcriptional regulator [Brevibacillus ruminantium]